MVGGSPVCSPVAAVGEEEVVDLVAAALAAAEVVVSVGLAAAAVAEAEPAADGKLVVYEGASRNIGLLITG